MANQENTAVETKKKSLLDRVIDLISSVFLPFITLMVAAGILKGIVALLTAANIIVEGHPLYSVFYAMGDAFFYFIPVFLAFTAAKRFGTEPFCAVLVACVLVHPTFVALMEAGEDFAILGLPAKAMTYSSTVIPHPVGSLHAKVGGNPLQKGDSGNGAGHPDPAGLPDSGHSGHTGCLWSDWPLYWQLGGSRIPVAVWA